jgi:hypothetical protein
MAIASREARKWNALSDIGQVYVYGVIEMTVFIDQK